MQFGYVPGKGTTDVVRQLHKKFKAKGKFTLVLLI